MTRRLILPVFLFCCLTVAVPFMEEAAKAEDLYSGPNFTDKLTTLDFADQTTFEDAFRDIVIEAFGGSVGTITGGVVSLPAINYSMDGFFYPHAAGIPVPLATQGNWYGFPAA